ncbi:hypothetical protein [Solimonas marina]|uniref:Uncharacterized protein n=1 Tax=Solimonas marina TaxID=2714601 RepID=A0A969WD89_9GAMM|nr:hypothetical protein [Solimonas marina]NKF23266.1 hypothetical protein [Solimonas marina]
MTPITELRVAVHGFSAEERHLLGQQLRTLQRRTRVNWAFAAPGEAAALTIEHPQRQADGRALARIRDAAGDELRAQLLDWPLRLSSLLTLLDEAEALLLSAHAARLRAQGPVLRLRRLAVPTLIAHDDVSVLVLPDDQELLANVLNFDGLVQAFLDLPPALPWRRVDAPQALSRTMHAYALPRLIWALSLQAPADPARGWRKAGVEYHLESWPHFGEWRTTPELMRLAAFYTRQHATLQQGAEFAHVEPEAVAIFLQACDACGLGLSQRAPAPVPVDAPRWRDRLLQRLRAANPDPQH